jgi:hypothetical protein
MPYYITLRSRTDASITAWYDGSERRWSTDHQRQKLFEKKRDAVSVCHDLRKLCPRNANVINIEERAYGSLTTSRAKGPAHVSGLERAAARPPSVSTVS